MREHQQPPPERLHLRERLSARRPRRARRRLDLAEQRRLAAGVARSQVQQERVRRGQRGFRTRDLATLAAPRRVDGVERLAQVHVRRHDPTRGGIVQEAKLRVHAPRGHAGSPRGSQHRRARPAPDVAEVRARRARVRPLAFHRPRVGRLGDGLRPGRLRGRRVGGTIVGWRTNSNTIDNLVALLAQRRVDRRGSLPRRRLPRAFEPRQDVLRDGAVDDERVVGARVIHRRVHERFHRNVSRLLRLRLCLVGIPIDGETRDGRPRVILGDPKRRRESNVPRGGRSHRRGHPAAAPRGPRGIRPGPKQRVGGARLAPPPGPHQRREPVLVGAVHVAPGGDDGANPSRVPLLSRGDESLGALRSRGAEPQPRARPGTQADEPLGRLSVFRVPAPSLPLHHRGELEPPPFRLRRDRPRRRRVQPRQVIVVVVALVEYFERGAPRTRPLRIRGYTLPVLVARRTVGVAASLVPVEQVTPRARLARRVAARAERHRATRLVDPTRRASTLFLRRALPLTNALGGGGAIPEPVPGAAASVAHVRRVGFGAGLTQGRVRILRSFAVLSPVSRLAASVAHIRGGWFTIVATDSLRRRHRAQAHVRGDHDEPRGVRGA
mmetsp:Transcript_3356/g.13638  ORF Transcript_3356/g.13638 Transcript_3356/m.13638 type:complete len:609 (+) Transcript_3356:149-1975(+)